MTDTLTKRQLEVAGRIAQGFSDKQVATELKVSRQRVTQIVDEIADAWRLDRSRNLRTQIATRSGLLLAS